MSGGLCQGIPLGAPAGGADAHHAERGAPRYLNLSASFFRAVAYSSAHRLSNGTAVAFPAFSISCYTAQHDPNRSFL
jgi:hypothetical protein